MISSTQTNQPFDGDSPALLDDEVQTATAKLKAAGLRVTQTRLKLLAALSKRREPASIEMLYRDVHASGCDLVTVYRCMAVFEEIGLVQQYFLHDGTAVYGLNTTGAPRYYVVCKATNRIDEIDPQFSNLLRQAVAIVEEMLRARGYKNVAHRVEFFGLGSGTSAAEAPERSGQADGDFSGDELTQATASPLND